MTRAVRLPRWLRAALFRAAITALPLSPLALFLEPADAVGLGAALAIVGAAAGVTSALEGRARRGREARRGDRLLTAAVGCWAAWFVGLSLAVCQFVYTGAALRGGSYTAGVQAVVGLWGTHATFLACALAILAGGAVPAGGFVLLDAGRRDRATDTPGEAVWWRYRGCALVGVLAAPAAVLGSVRPPGALVALGVCVLSATAGLGAGFVLLVSLRATEQALRQGLRRRRLARLGRAAASRG